MAPRGSLERSGRASERGENRFVWRRKKRQGGEREREMFEKAGQNIGMAATRREREGKGMHLPTGS